jgi:hypothetical protein
MREREKTSDAIVGSSPILISGAAHLLIARGREGGRKGERKNKTK